MYSSDQKRLTALFSLQLWSIVNTVNVTSYIFFYSELKEKVFLFTFLYVKIKAIVSSNIKFGLCRIWCSFYNLNQEETQSTQLTFYDEIISIYMEKLSPEYGSSLTVLSHLATSQFMSGRVIHSACFKVWRLLIPNRCNATQRWPGWSG